eukprot:6758783-Pyramimonas_sp.AAC.1
METFALSLASARHCIPQPVRFSHLAAAPGHVDLLCQPARLLAILLATKLLHTSRDRLQLLLDSVALAGPVAFESFTARAMQTCPRLTSFSDQQHPLFAHPLAIYDGVLLSRKVLCHTFSDAFRGKVPSCLRVAAVLNLTPLFLGYLLRLTLYRFKKPMPS